jgi:hypothetical protein
MEAEVSELGWMRQDYNARGLIQLCRDLPSGLDGVEVGCYEGDSTQIFINSGKFRRLFSVDPYIDGISGENYPNPLADAKKKFKAVTEGHHQVWHLETTSQEASKLLYGLQFDFVYLDGDHRYESVRSDIMHWMPLVKKGGYLCGHDYESSNHGGVIQAVNELLGPPERVYEDHSWVHRSR